MVNDFSQSPGEKECRASEIENMLAFDARRAQAFDRGGRLAALQTERRLDRNQAGPAFRTCPSPPTLLNRSLTLDACDWEQEIENVVEQSAFGETQRANS